MITRYLRPALLIIAAAVAVTTAQSLWNVDRTRAVLLIFIAIVCVGVALMRLTMAKR